MRSGLEKKKISDLLVSSNFACTQIHCTTTPSSARRAEKSEGGGGEDGCTLEGLEGHEKEEQ